MPSSQNDGYIHQPLSHNDGVSFQLRTGSSKSIKTGGGREGSRAGGGREGSRSGGGREGGKTGGGREEDKILTNVLCGNNIATCNGECVSESSGNSMDIEGIVMGMFNFLFHFVRLSFVNDPFCSFFSIVQKIGFVREFSICFVRFSLNNRLFSKIVCSKKPFGQ